MIGLGLLSFTLVGVGTASTPRDARASAETAPVCRTDAPLQSLQTTPPQALAVLPQGVGTGGTAGSGPPLNAPTSARAVPLAAATPKAPTTQLIFFSLGARQ